MKKLFSILFFLLTALSWSQTSPPQNFNTPLKFNVVNKNQNTFKVLTLDGTNLVSWNDMNSLSGMEDGFVSVASVTQQSANEYLFTTTVWRINNTQYTDASELFTIPAATEGFYRTDIIVGNSSGALVRVQGTESASNPVTPTIPVNSVLITHVNVFGEDVTIPPVDPEIPTADQVFEQGRFVHIEDGGPISIMHEDSGYFSALTLGTEGHSQLGGAVTQLFGTQLIDFAMEDGTTVPRVNNNNYIAVSVNTIQADATGAITIDTEDIANNGEDGDHPYWSVLDYFPAALKIEYPAEFTFRPFGIYEINGNFFTDKSNKDLVKDKISKMKPYYVDYIDGSNSNNGQTETTAFKTMAYAISQGARLIYLQGGDIIQNDGWGSIIHNLNQDVFVIAKGDKPAYVMNNLTGLSFSLESGSTYQATIGANTIPSVVDFDFRDSYGYPLALRRQTSLALVNSTANSYFVSGTTLYIHLKDNRVPDGDVYPMKISTDNYFASQNQVYFYGENICFMGGGHAFALRGQLSSGAAGMVGLMNNCSFLYGNQNGFAASVNPGIFWSENCRGYMNGRDGFNYSQGNNYSTMRAIEINCQGFENGTNTADLTAALNGSSGHNDLTFLRVNNKYWANVGPNVADVNGALSFNIGVECFESLGFDDVPVDPGSAGKNWADWGDFGVGTIATEAGTKMWLYGCKSFDTRRSYFTPEFLADDITLDPSVMYVNKSINVSPYSGNIIFGDFVTGDAAPTVFPALSTGYVLNDEINLQYVMTNGSEGTVITPIEIRSATDVAGIVNGVALNLDYDTVSGSLQATFDDTETQSYSYNSVNAFFDQTTVDMQSNYQGESTEAEPVAYNSYIMANTHQDDGASIFMHADSTGDVFASTTMTLNSFSGANITTDSDINLIRDDATTVSTINFNPERIQIKVDDVDGYGGTISIDDTKTTISSEIAAGRTTLSFENPVGDNNINIPAPVVEDTYTLPIIIEGNQANTSGEVLLPTFFRLASGSPQTFVDVWIGTEAEYEALGAYPPALYFTSDSGNPFYEIDDTIVVAQTSASLNIAKPTASIGHTVVCRMIPSTPMKYTKMTSTEWEAVAITLP